ncbi:cysteine desulfurase [Candidatus Roizmanbacteria bacterium]|nr:cysteine desulfurase [Candidatus Roizmanbacteria bacterium]
MHNIKSDFPIFEHLPNLVYLDSTATALKPRVVIEKLTEYYTQYSANIYRGLYRISEKATQEFEAVREHTARFINAKPNEVIFTRNTTEAINLIAYSLGRSIIQEGDEIVTTIMEHHANFVPWQQLAFENGVDLKVVDIDDEGNLQSLDTVITKRTKLLALTAISNVLGTINPIKDIVKKARTLNPEIIIILDAAQAVPHMKLDVIALDCDFIAFSSHKMCGPTGVGVLWGKQELLQQMPPFLFGGEMISEVSLEKTTFQNPPQRFEAGTPAIGEVIAFGAALSYLESIGMDTIRAHERQLTRYALERLDQQFGDDIRVFGPQNEEDRAGIVAFRFRTVHPHDVAQILDQSQVAVRAGHHCAMPLHKRLQVPATTRASFYVYTTEEDIEKFIKALQNVKEVLCTRK